MKGPAAYTGKMHKFLHDAASVLSYVTDGIHVRFNRRGDNVSGGVFEISGRDVITSAGYFHTCISRHETNHRSVSILRAQAYAPKEVCE